MQKSHRVGRLLKVSRKQTDRKEGRSLTLGRQLLSHLDELVSVRGRVFDRLFDIVAPAVGDPVQISSFLLRLTSRVYPL